LCNNFSVKLIYHGFTVRANDDLSQRLRFTPGAGVPLGAAIDSSGGVFIWRPGELDGPGICSVDIIVTDDGFPALSSTGVVEIVVREVNSALVLLPVAGRVVNVNDTLMAQLIASDSDVPVQKLVYSVIRVLMVSVF